jgi:hypothetical protein
MAKKQRKSTFQSFKKVGTPKNGALLFETKTPRAVKNSSPFPMARFSRCPLLKRTKSYLDW